MSFIKQSTSQIHLPVVLAALLLGNGAFSFPAQSQPAGVTDLAQMPIGAGTFYVNPTTGTDAAGAGTTATPYRTITYALQQAGAGTVVQLAPGSYTNQTGEVFPLVVKEGVTLLGESSTKGQRMAIIGGGSFASPTAAGQNITILAQNNSEINGITITNPNSRGTGVWVESTNPAIRNNTFSNSNREGVFVTGTGNPKIEDNVFSKNAGNGISVARQSTGEIRNNLIQETGTGIALTETAAPLITDNRIVQNNDGIIASGSSAPLIRKNAIENNKASGVVATGDAKPNLGTADSVGGNRIRNNGTSDVYNVTRNNTIVAVGNDIDQKRIIGRVDFVAATVATDFPDIQGHWAQAYIKALTTNGTLAGFPDGTFRPNDPVTRAQFAAIIAKAFAPTPQKAASDFVDVSRNYWAYQVIQTAYRGAFLAGYPDRTFRAEERIPRVQVLVSLASGLNLRSDNTSVLSVYGDAAQIPNYALTAIAGATQKKLVVNYPAVAQLNPNQNATRADVAAFVYQALVNAGTVPPIASPYLVNIP